MADDRLCRPAEPFGGLMADRVRHKKLRIREAE